MNRKNTILIVGLIVIAFAGFAVFFFNPARLTPENPAGKTMYYTVIKNDSVKLTNENRFEYKLDCYDENGGKKALTFTTGIKQKDGTFVELYVAPLRGVTYWHGIKPESMPDKVRKIYIG